MKTSDEGALRATMALLAAAAVLSSSCQMGPGSPMAALMSQGRAGDMPASAAIAAAQGAPAAGAAAGESPFSPVAAARWYAWRAVFGTQATVAGADDNAAEGTTGPLAWPADNARGAKP